MAKDESVLEDEDLEDEEDETDWECVPCNWFMFASALEFQRSVGIQGDIPKCPECKRPLTQCEIGG